MRGILGLETQECRAQNFLFVSIHARIASLARNFVYIDPHSATEDESTFPRKLCRDLESRFVSFIIKIQRTSIWVLVQRNLDCLFASILAFGLSMGRKPVPGQSK